MSSAAKFKLQISLSYLDSEGKMHLGACKQDEHSGPETLVSVSSVLKKKIFEILTSAQLLACKTYRSQAPYVILVLLLWRFNPFSKHKPIPILLVPNQVFVQC